MDGIAMNKVFRTQFSLQSGVKGWSKWSNYTVFGLPWDIRLHGYPGWVSKSFSMGLFYSCYIDLDFSKWIHCSNTSRRSGTGVLEVISEDWHFLGGKRFFRAIFFLPP